MADQDECALWYWWHHTMDYQLFDSEEQAASYAIYLDEYDEGVPVGVQLADGRTIRVGQWPAIAAAQRTRQLPATGTPEPMRAIRDPFNGERVMVEVTEPDWLGKP